MHKAVADALPEMQDVLPDKMESLKGKFLARVKQPVATGPAHGGNLGKLKTVGDAGLFEKLQEHFGKPVGFGGIWVLTLNSHQLRSLLTHIPISGSAAVVLSLTDTPVLITSTIAQQFKNHNGQKTLPQFLDGDDSAIEIGNLVPKRCRR